jgi:hypothetical protein
MHYSEASSLLRNSLAGLVCEIAIMTSGKSPATYLKSIFMQVKTCLHGDASHRKLDGRLSQDTHLLVAVRLALFVPVSNKVLGKVIAVKRLQRIPSTRERIALEVRMYKTGGIHVRQAIRSRCCFVFLCLQIQHNLLQ